MAESDVIRVFNECGDEIAGSLEVHNYENHIRKTYVYVCPVCQTEYLRERNLAVHLQIVESHAYINPAAFKRPTRAFFTKLQQCSMCSFQCVSQTKLVEHMRASHVEGRNNASLNVTKPDQRSQRFESVGGVFAPTRASSPIII